MISTFLSSFSTAIEKRPGRAFGVAFTCLALFSLIHVFFGFDLCDSGFYMTFYDNLLQHPEVVEYNYMYYLSGLVGSSFMALFPHAGIFELRLLGWVCHLSVIVLLYYSLRRYLSISSLIVGFTIVVVGYISMPMTFYNDLLTALLFVAALCLLLRGLNKNKSYLIILAGFVFALNTFSRIPNVLEVLSVVLILIHQIYYRESGRLAAKRCIAFLVAFIVGIFAILLLMRGLGHYNSFLANLKELTSIASDSSGTCSHTTSNLISIQFVNYFHVLKFCIKIVLPTLVLFYAARYLHNKLVVWLLYIASAAVLAYFFYLSDPVNWLFAFCLIGLVGNLLSYPDKEVKMWSWAGLGMMLVFPVGSDWGMYNNGSIIFWIAAPVAASFFLNLKDGTVPLICLPKVAVRSISMGLAGLFVVVCVGKTLADGVYFDGGCVFLKSHRMMNNRVQGIFTTASRAQIVDDVTMGIRPFVKPGDCMMCYGSIPTLNYMTRTLPFAGCSWPDLLSEELLSRRLDSYNGPLPWVLRQKFDAIGKEIGKPSERYLTDCGMENGAFQSNRKIRVLNRFLKRHHYCVVFENRYFVLLKPGISNP